MFIIARGPAFPLPAVICRDWSNDEELSHWRISIATALRSSAVEPSLQALMITGFVAMDAADYQSACRGRSAIAPG